MSAYVVRRLLLFVPSLLGAATLIFVLTRAMPGDYVDAIMADPNSAGASAAQVAAYEAALRQELGLNDPLPIQYIRWIGSLARGDLGTSLSQHRPAVDAVEERLAPTIEIAVLSLILACAWSIPVGVVSGYEKSKTPDVLGRLAAAVFLSIPPFWMGVLALFFMITWVHTGPPLIFEPLWVSPVENLKMVIWPSVILALHVGAPISRLVRYQLIETLGEDYMRTAAGKGLRARDALVRHAMKNIAIPLLTLVAGQFGRLLGGVVVMEAVFNVPGIGTGLLGAVGQRDYALVGAFLLVTSSILLLLNLAVDLAYSRIDPRVRLG